jgi:photosystem II stability/assembly factor-like uncharacterized protein
MNPQVLFSMIPFYKREGHLLRFDPHLERSVDGGKHWDEYIFSSHISSYSLADFFRLNNFAPSQLLLQANNRKSFLTSSDGGENWQIINDSLPDDMKIMAVDPHNPNFLYATSLQVFMGRRTSKTTLYQSIDAGKTWVEMAVFDNISMHKLQVHPENKDLLFNTFAKLA